MLAHPTVPRIPPVVEPDEATEAILAKTLVRDGAPLNVFTTLAHNPRLLQRLNVLGGLFLTKSTIPARERELVVLRVGALARSRYEFGQHVLLAREAGVTDDEIAAIARGTGPWSAQDQAVLDLAEEIHTDCGVSDATWQALSREYTAAQLLELVALAGFYRMLASLLNAVGIEPEPGVPAWFTDQPTAPAP